MGYTTNFDGKFTLSKEPTLSQYRKLKSISKSRHLDNRRGTDGVPEPGAPSYYCQWVLSKDCLGLEWDGNEKFDKYTEWLQLLLDRYFTPWGIQVTGSIHYQGDSIGDYGSLSVVDGRVIKSPKK